MWLIKIFFERTFLSSLIVSFAAYVLCRYLKHFREKLHGLCRHVTSSSYARCEMIEKALRKENKHSAFHLVYSRRRAFSVYCTKVSQCPIKTKTKAWSCWNKIKKMNNRLIFLKFCLLVSVLVVRNWLNKHYKWRLEFNCCSLDSIARSKKYCYDAVELCFIRGSRNLKSIFMLGRKATLNVRNNEIVSVDDAIDGRVEREEDSRRCRR